MKNAEEIVIENFGPACPHKEGFTSVVEMAMEEAAEEMLNGCCGEVLKLLCAGKTEPQEYLDAMNALPLPGDKE